MGKPKKDRGSSLTPIEELEQRDEDMAGMMKDGLMALARARELKDNFERLDREGRDLVRAASEFFGVRGARLEGVGSFSFRAPSPRLSEKLLRQALVKYLDVETINKVISESKGSVGEEYIVFRRE